MTQPYTRAYNTINHWWLLVGVRYTMALKTKYFLPTLARTIYGACTFITKHRDVIIAAVTELSPGDVTAVTDAMGCVVTACNAFITAMNHIDPNWRP